jgi:hypothetical protein
VLGLHTRNDSEREDKRTEKQQAFNNPSQRSFVVVERADWFRGEQGVNKLGESVHDCTPLRPAIDRLKRPANS